MIIFKQVRRKHVTAITFSTKISLSVLYNQQRILLYWGFTNHITQVFINCLVTDPNQDKFGLKLHQFIHQST